MQHPLIMRVECFGKGVPQCEGILVDRDNHVYGGGRDGVIYKVSPDGETRALCALPDGSVPNGIAMDRQGNIVFCDLGRKAVMRVSQDGDLSMIADRVGGIAMITPNFCTFDAEGNLFVSNSTSRIYDGDLYKFTSTPVPDGAVVRIRPDGRGDVVATGLCLANGTAIDPQEEALYVLQSSLNNCLRIPLRKDGSFGKPEIYSENFPGSPDGMAFAADGTLIVTLPIAAIDGEVKAVDRIIRVDTDGEWSMFLDAGDMAEVDHATNCAFGGTGMNELYVTNLEADHFNRLTTGLRGHPLFHQR